MVSDFADDLARARERRGSDLHDFDPLTQVCRVCGQRRDEMETPIERPRFSDGRPGGLVG